MHTITSQLLLQQEDFNSPFDDRAPGYRDWWIDAFAEPRNPDHRPYSFTESSGCEVARALLSAQAGFIDLQETGVSIPTNALSIDFLEVREDLLSPRRGIGTLVVREIESLYPDNTLYAFSEGANRFWQSTGWEFIPRKDGRTDFGPLFVGWR